MPRDHAPAGTPKRRLKGYDRTRFRCPHLLQVWTWGPHPRYGDRMPTAHPSLIADPNCGCP